MSAEEPILPIIDRRAPILERIRNRNDGNRNVAQNLGELVGRAVKTDSEVEIEETRDSFTNGFAESLAEELGVSLDEIDEEFVDNITSGVLDVNEGDVLTESAIENLDIQVQDIIKEAEGQTDDGQGESNESDGEVSESSEEQTEEDGGEEEEESESSSELFEG